VWGAWFDADATPPSRSAKRFAPLDAAVVDEGETLIRTFDSRLSRTAAAGAVDGIAWDVTWQGGRELHEDVPSWLPTPTHARPIVHDADVSGRVDIGGTPIELRGRAYAMHLWGKRRVPTLHWIWAPWIGDGSLEVSAVSLRDTFALGLASLRLDGPHPLTGRPATAAHPNTLITATVAGPRRLVHARAWAEAAHTVGYVYRDTDERDLMVAQSDIGSAQFEVFTRKAPGTPWHPVDERRVAGGVAVEIHQRTPLPGVDYLGWDETTQPTREATGDRAVEARGADTVDWPEVTSIVALGLTYGDHVRETGQKLDASAPPTSFTKHASALAPGDGMVRVPDTAAVLAALDEVEPGLGAQIRERIPHVPPVMDYEGELALVALGPIDDAQLAAGTPQPFGLAAANDLTARLVQTFGASTEQRLAFWTAAKSFPGFLPVAPQVWAPPGGLAKLPELTLATRVNGDVRQQASTKLLIYDLPAIARAASAHLGRPLARGDVILTGTPAGVGLRISPITRKVASLIKDRFRRAELLVSTYATSTALLRPGDVIEIDAGPAGRVRTRLGV
jgi:2-keto-4-pentenoate hydratase/2-oxohepta-3-ene-1,7-dioic acid hydratase in catechol pathway